MNDPLDQLFDSARRAPRPTPDPEAPFGLEARVLASWRADREQEWGGGWLGAFRPVMAAAAGVMLLCVGLNFSALIGLRDRLGRPTALTLVEAPLQLAMNP